MAGAPERSLRSVSPTLCFPRTETHPCSLAARPRACAPSPPRGRRSPEGSHGRTVPTHTVHITGKKGRECKRLVKKTTDSSSFSPLSLALTILSLVAATYICHLSPVTYQCGKRDVMWARVSTPHPLWWVQENSDERLKGGRDTNNIVQSRAKACNRTLEVPSCGVCWIIKRKKNKKNKKINKLQKEVRGWWKWEPYLLCGGGFASKEEGDWYGRIGRAQERGTGLGMRTYSMSLEDKINGEGEKKLTMKVCKKKCVTQYADSATLPRPQP